MHAVPSFPKTDQMLSIPYDRKFFLQEIDLQTGDVFMRKFCLWSLFIYLFIYFYFYALQVLVFSLGINLFQLTASREYNSENIW